MNKCTLLDCTNTEIMYCITVVGSVFHTHSFGTDTHTWRFRALVFTGAEYWDCKHFWAALYISLLMAYLMMRPRKKFTVKGNREYTETELKTLEWDSFNPYWLINLEINNKGENKHYLTLRLRKIADQALIPKSTIQKFQALTVKIPKSFLKSHSLWVILYVINQA